MTTTQEHEQICESFLDNAEAEFKRRDYLQASEKSWGAVAHFIKAFAKERGMLNGAHWHLSAAADEMFKVLDKPDDARLKYAAANALHQHFYENHLTIEQVRANMRSVRDLIADLKEARSRM